MSASLLVGIPKFVNNDHGAIAWNDDAFRAYREIAPMATPGYSIYVYDLSPEDVAQIRAAQEREQPAR